MSTSLIKEIWIDFKTFLNKDAFLLRNEKDLLTLSKFYFFIKNNKVNSFDLSRISQKINDALIAHTQFNVFKAELLELFSQNDLSTECTLEDNIQWYIWYCQDYTTEDVFLMEIADE